MDLAFRLDETDAGTQATTNVRAINNGQKRGDFCTGPFLKNKQLCCRVFYWTKGILSKSGGI